MELVVWDQVIEVFIQLEVFFRLRLLRLFDALKRLSSLAVVRMGFVFSVGFKADQAAIFDVALWAFVLDSVVEC